MEHRRLFSQHRSHVAWRPKPPGQIGFGPTPTRTGPEHRRRSPQWHRHEAQLGRSAGNGANMRSVEFWPWPTRPTGGGYAVSAREHISASPYAFGGTSPTAIFVLCVCSTHFGSSSVVVQFALPWGPLAGPFFLKPQKGFCGSHTDKL
jgi:hypothetical protein